MTHHAPTVGIPLSHEPGPLSHKPGRQVAQLREALMLVEQIAGLASASTDSALDEAARISGAYDAAAPIVQRRFDALVAETAGWAASGVEALLAAGRPGDPPRAAAARLAEELGGALRELSRVLRLHSPA